MNEEITYSPSNLLGDHSNSNLLSISRGDFATQSSFWIPIDVLSTNNFQLIWPSNVLRWKGFFHFLHAMKLKSKVFLDFYTCYEMDCNFITRKWVNKIRLSIKCRKSVFRSHVFQLQIACVRKFRLTNCRWQYLPAICFSCVIKFKCIIFQ